MMRDVIAQGTATSLPNYVNNTSVDWAGKTGTSQEHRDAWFIGTNPNVTFGAWLGFDTPSNLSKACPGCSLNHSQRIIKFWSEMVNVAADINPDLVTPTDKFKRPEGIVERSYCAISGNLPSELCKKLGLVKTDLFNIKYVPTEEDDSLVSGNYVMIDGKAYLAGKNTPREFVRGAGYMFNKKCLEEKGYDKLNNIKEIYPLNDNRSAWEKIRASSADVNENDSDVPDTGKRPSVPRKVKHKNG